MNRYEKAAVAAVALIDRKSTRLNSSHDQISYAVFCLKKNIGETDRAERHLKEALALGVSDQFLLAAYADFLLDRGRPQEVVTLLKDWTRSDPLLLLLALAEKVLGAPVLEEHVRTLKSRFDAAAMRGDKLHQQEEARFNLYLLGQRPRALALAKENWT